MEAFVDGKVRKGKNLRIRAVCADASWDIALSILPPGQSKANTGGRIELTPEAAHELAHHLSEMADVAISRRDEWELDRQARSIS